MKYYTQTHRGNINEHRLNLMEVSLGDSNRTWEGYGNGVTEGVSQAEDVASNKDFMAEANLAHFRNLKEISAMGSKR